MHVQHMLAQQHSLFGRDSFFNVFAARDVPLRVKQKHFVAKLLPETVHSIFYS